MYHNFPISAFPLAIHNLNINDFLRQILSYFSFLSIRSFSKIIWTYNIE